ncbi:MAG: hypothetical protein AAB309_01120 [Deltaproteobacteria bacterium]
MKSTLKWLYAKINLAVAFLLHLFFKRWFRKRGLKEFLAFYSKDHVFALTGSERKDLSTFGNCVYCGLCVSECREANPRFYETFATPANIAFSSYCPDCSACEKVCPTGVPLNQIVGFVKRHAG